MTVGEFDVALLVAAVILLVAVTAVRLTSRLGVPSLLVYVGIGLVLGESGVGLRFDDAQLAQTLGYAALVLILAEGGLTSDWPSLRRVLPAAGALSTVGVAATIGIGAVTARLALGFDWKEAVLLAAVLAPTDAAAVFATLRGLPMRRRTRTLLEAESGSNDPLVVLVVAGIATGDWTDRAPVEVVGLVAYEIGAGLAIGIAVGLIGRAYLRRTALPAAGLYPLAALGFCVLGYSVAAVLHGSGFIAVYATGVALGAAQLPHREATRAFTDGLTWSAQIGLFVMLGLLASPSRLPGAVLPALAVGVVLLLVGRPLAVLLSTSLFGVRWREQAFLSLAGLRGAVPIVLATIPITAGVAGSDRIFDVVFVVVVVFTLVQGLVLPRLLSTLGLVDELVVRESGVDAAPLSGVGVDMLQLHVPPESKLHGVYVGSLRLPEQAVLSLIMRDDEPIVPDSMTRLRRGDVLFVVTPATQRAATEARLRAVSRGGELAGWLGADEQD